MERYEEYKDSGVQWLGEIPGHWECVRLKHTGTTRNGLTYSPGDEVTENNGFLVLRSSNIQDGKLCFKDNVYVNKQIDESLFMKKDDILICSRNGSRDLVGKLVRIKEDMACSFGAFMMVYRTTKWASFMAYSLQVAISNYKNLFSTSTINQLVKAKFDNFYIPLPPLSEQQAIVSFLDTKTSQIDTYIAGKEKEIDLLKSTKQRIIADAVTKGIKPGVEMRETSIFWLQEMPAHWGLRKMKYLFSERSEKNHPEEPMLSATQTEGVILQSKYKGRVVVVNTGFEGLKLVCIGDFVIHLRSFQGGIEIAHDRGIISSAYTILDLLNKEQSDYFKYLFKSIPFIDLLKTCVTGIREGQNINYSKLKQEFLPIPPLPEQLSIVTYIKEKTEAIDAAINKLTDQIELIKKYKQRLISDVVTGQIKV